MLLLGFAVLAAGLFGALHNQVSYSISPEYFHAFKFRQFGLPPEIAPRLGAALVGWRASWWMGLILGPPVFLLGLILLPDARLYWRAGLRALLAIFLFTALISALGILFGLLFLGETALAQLPLPEGLNDPLGFLRAGIMHEASYVGGFLGILVGVWILFKIRKVGT